MSAAAIVLPGRIPGLVGPIATGPGDEAEMNSLRYRGIFSAEDVQVSGGGCGNGSVAARVSIASLSLFGGALSAGSVSLTAGQREQHAIAGLRAEDAHASTSTEKWRPLAGWGEWRIGSAAGATAAALTVRLLHPHAGLPAGTIMLVAVAGLHARATASTPARGLRHHHRRLGGRPLRITPPLAVAHESFPVVGTEATFGDTYGGFRSDVAGNWHHGDDIFAPLGTPVVAVADGTINRLGWNAIGGWRLWIRDDGGDEFYYAHLSGYTRADLRSNRVREGEVVGFVGNTGDAFTTAPHLHFEIHPRSLLHLRYNGAVDPTGYLQRWVHLSHVHAPTPVHPALPTEPALRAEARNVWRQLLTARGLERQPASVSARQVPTFPLQPLFPERAGISASDKPRAISWTPWLTVGLCITLVAALATRHPRRRRRSDGDSSTIGTERA